MISNKQILLKILTESLVVEKDEEEAQESETSGTVVEGQTDNKLMQGRPPDSVQNSKELAREPAGSKQLLQSLGATASGTGTWRNIESLFNSAVKNKDFGALVSSAEQCTNEAKNKQGVLLKVKSGPMSESAKNVYFFLRSLYTAGINAGQVQVSSSDKRKMRMEKTVDSNFVIYVGKAKSWNAE